MGSAFHQLCPRYSGTLTPTAPTANRLWETFTFYHNEIRGSIPLTDMDLKFNKTGLQLYDYNCKYIQI